LTRIRPFRPLRAPGLPAPPVPGRYKLQPEDFVVDEIPLYEPSGSGGHLFLRIEKRGLSTLAAVARVAEVFGVPQRVVGYAGLKDKHAVTRQWLSVERGDVQRATELDGPGLRVLDVRPHGNKLKVGHLRGNRFEIVLRDCGADALDSVRTNLAWLQRHGVPNWVGEQRFGSRGLNLEKGLRVLEGDPRQAVRQVPKRLLRLLVSAVQSEVFNRVLGRRLDTFDRLLDGDVAWLHRNGACFLIEDAFGEAVRCERFEISPSGPLPGPRMLHATGKPGVLEDGVMAEMGLDLARFGRVPGKLNAGARRPLRVPLNDTEAEPVDGGLRLRFALLRGAFATSVLRELLADAPWFGDEDDAEAASDLDGES
jgi:tRNA pseudouridine13 synthase